MSRIAAALAALALGVSVYATQSQQALGDPSVSRLAHDYIQTIAAQAGVTVVYEKLLAYETDGDKSVARVKIRYAQEVYDVDTGKFVNQETTTVLVLHLSKSLWRVTDAKVAP